MRAVVHVGMHKTGSSAIQNHFSAASYPGLHYAPWRDPNHCGLYVLLFEEPARLGQYHGFRAQGPAFVGTLPAQRAEWRARLDDKVATLGPSDTLLISAEDISHPGLADARAALFAYLLERADDVQVVGYLRPPLSFARSAFQEMLKGPDLSALSFDQLWPHYQARFGPLDRIVGPENVQLRLYARDALHRGDVVSDFGLQLGLDVAPGKGDDNESLSAEATALLFMQRKLGRGFESGFPDSWTVNNRLVAQLRRVGHHALTFAPEAWEPVLARHGADVAWAEARLGRPLSEPVIKDAIEIGSEDDLIGLAVGLREDLERVLLARIAEVPLAPRAKTLLALELLRQAGKF